jgi:hypothetical protein
MILLFGKPDMKTLKEIREENRLTIRAFAIKAR